MKLLKILFFIFLSINCFSQHNVDSLTTALLKNKKENYFELQRYFKRVRFSDKQTETLLVKSIAENYSLGVIFAKNLQARSYRHESQYLLAEEKYKEALTLARKYKKIAAEIITSNQIGVLFRRQDKIRRALNYHHAALEIISKQKKETRDLKASKSITINSIGNIYLTLRQYDLALKEFEESIEVQRELNDKRGLAINHQNIGYAYKNLGNIDLALQNFNLSLQYNIENKDKLGKVICHNSISKVLIIKGEYNKAYDLITEVLALAESLRNKYYLTEVYNTAGWVSVKLGDFNGAEKHLQKALKLGTDYKIPSILTLTYKYLSELYEKKGNYQESLSYYKKSIELGEKTFNEKNITWVTGLMSKFDDEVKNSKLKNLARENEISKLKLIRNRNILIIALVSIALFGVLLYSIYRQRLLRNDKQILLLEQEALRIQMNPHFVFNALNSIKLYIINNEQKNAVYYLNKFSKLIRNILESSTVKEVTLAEELKTMDLYMSIENIRFSNEIEYEKNVSAIVNPETIKVPPLILQPFLENAIWHGLSSKKGEKQVALTVTKLKEGYIQIDIEDNGIGRVEALKIKKSKSLNRKSIGIDLTKERLKNFASQYQNNYSLKYNDQLDASGKVVGTKVALKIPLV